MYGLFDWQFWLSLLWFLVAGITSWYIPGSNLLRRFRLPVFTHYLVAFVTGLVLWGFQGYIFGYLQLRWLTYIYLLANLAWWLRSWSAEKKYLSEFRTYSRRIPWQPVVVLVLGSLLQLTQVITTGLKYQDRIAFFRINAYDGVLHLAFIRALVKAVPAEQPGAIGIPLNHYHYWSDLIAADMHRIWQLPIIHLFFQFMPVVLAVGTGLALWKVIRHWQGSTSTVVWCLLLLYLAGDLAYVFTLWLHGTWGVHVAAIDNGAMQFLNIPHGYAKLVFITALIPLTTWFHKKSLSWGLITALLLASLFGLKVYFGIFAALGMSLVVAGYGCITLFHAWRRPHTLLTEIWKLRWLLIPYLLLAISAALIYFPSNHDSGGLLWSPLEWPKLFLGHDHIYWQEWWLRKQVYEAANSWKGNLAMDSLAIGICLLSVYGLRILGFLPSPTWYKRLGWQLVVFLLPTSLLCTLLGLYTLQVSGLFNVFNFFAVSAVPLALLTGLTLDTWWKKPNWLFKILPILILGVGLPRIAMTTHEAVTYSWQHRYEQSISGAQLAAFTYIREQLPANALIQSHPANSFDRQTPYVAFFTNRPTYLTGVGMLQSHNQPITARHTKLKKIFASSSSLLLKNELHAEGIEYLYLEKKPEQQLPFPLPDTELPAVFENEETLVLKIY